ncbi:MAG: SUMF1/EgtB/PvdO family nonheme iron enzyme, partial [bacterium]
MGIFAKLGRKIAGKPPATNGTAPPRPTNGNGPYRGLDDKTQQMALAATSCYLTTLGIEIIHIPATPEGKGFPMGNTKYSDEQPVRQVQLASFGLSETPITNKQYAAYLDATKQKNGLDLTNKADHPVVNVSWFDAIRFCNWLSIANGREVAYTINDDNTVEWDRTKEGFRLPTEAEWEYAARGLDGREYPWGNEPPDPSRANYWHDGSPKTTTPVGSYPAGKGPFDHLDLAGNVWEWCYDWLANYVAKDVNNPSGPKKGEFRV